MKGDPDAPSTDKMLKGPTAKTHCMAVVSESCFRSRRAPSSCNGGGEEHGSKVGTNKETEA